MIAHRPASGIGMALLAAALASEIGGAPTDESDKPRRCTVCKGRGAIRCDCWPGDCICGWDDEPCEYCDGTGWIDREEDYP